MYLPDIDWNGEAGIIGAKPLTYDPHNEVTGPQDTLLVQLSRQLEAGLAPRGHHTHRDVLLSRGQSQGNILSHHPNGPDLANDGPNGQVLPDKEADGGPASLQETSLVRLGQCQGDHDQVEQAQ